MNVTSLKIETSPKGYSYVTVSGAIARPCARCNGAIRINQWQHVEGGKCFRCNGEGAEAKRFTTVEAFEASETKRLKAQAKRQEREEAKAEAYAERARVEAEAQAKAEAEAQAENAKWTHLDGAEGEKVTVTGAVTVSVTIDTNYGQSRLIVVETPERQAVKLFTSAEWAWSVESGEAITVTGVIKAHTVYEGRPQTQLVRPKLTS